MYGPPNVTLMSDADEADGARLKADAAGGVAEDDDGAELAARRAASGSTGGALLREKRASSGDGDFLVRMEGSARTCGARSTANGYMLSNREKRQTKNVSGAWGAEWIRQEFPPLPQHLCRDRTQPLNLLYVAWMHD